MLFLPFKILPAKKAVPGAFAPGTAFRCNKCPYLNALSYFIGDSLHLFF